MIDGRCIIKMGDDTADGDGNEGNAGDCGGGSRGDGDSQSTVSTLTVDWQTGLAVDWQ